MCGICGIVNQKESESPDPGLIRNMLGALTHRGPDSSGYFRDKSALLGHTRLAIIDLTGGAQPLSNEDESLWITFNGEIFNYLELREELEGKGHVFHTSSDTETILHAWEEWGPGCFTRFNGQWAFAIWDRRRKELIISRDRHGIRPLYYTLSGNRFLFGSEIKALFCDRTLNRAFDPEGLAEIFTFWGPVAPRTAYEGIRELPPGYFGIVKAGKITTEPYWSIDFPGPAGAPESLPEADIRGYTEEFRSLLIDSARIRFTRSDVPVGAYLSGGIDSSVTTAILARYTNAKLNTYSLRFQDAEFDEGRYQKEMAQRLGTVHQDVVVSNRDIGEVFPEVMRYAERPILRTAPAPLFLLSRLVHTSGYKVVVTGEGADEVLAGYDIFREARFRRFAAENPGSPLIDSYLEQLYPWMERTPGKVPAFARAFFSKNLALDDPFLSHRPRWTSSAAVMQMFSPDLRARIGEKEPAEALRERLPQNFGSWPPLCRDQWLEYSTLLSGYLLSAQGDRMLMANSVEGRFPFLDYRLVEFANRLPEEMKLKGFTEKYILKEAFSDLIPPSILERPKQPYRAPDAQSFFGGEGKLDWVEELTSETAVKEAGLFNPTAVKGLMNKCRGIGAAKMSNTDNMRVVGILSSMLCHSHFINEAGYSAEPPRGLSTVIER